MGQQQMADPPAWMARMAAGAGRPSQFLREHQPRGIFPVSRRVQHQRKLAAAVQQLVAHRQSQSFSLPDGLDLHGLRLFAARPHLARKFALTTDRKRWHLLNRVRNELDAFGKKVIKEGENEGKNGEKGENTEKKAFGVRTTLQLKKRQQPMVLVNLAKFDGKEEEMGTGTTSRSNVDGITPVATQTSTVPMSSTTMPMERFGRVHLDKELALSTTVTTIGVVSNVPLLEPSSTITTSSSSSDLPTISTPMSSSSFAERVFPQIWTVQPTTTNRGGNQQQQWPSTSIPDRASDFDDQLGTAMASTTAMARRTTTRRRNGIEGNNNNGIGGEQQLIGIWNDEFMLMGKEEEEDQKKQHQQNININNNGVEEEQHPVKNDVVEAKAPKKRISTTHTNVMFAMKHEGEEGEKDGQWNGMEKMDLEANVPMPKKLVEQQQMVNVKMLKKQTGNGKNADGKNAEIVKKQKKGTVARRHAGGTGEGEAKNKAMPKNTHGDLAKNGLKKEAAIKGNKKSNLTMDVAMKDEKKIAGGTKVEITLQAARQRYLAQKGYRARLLAAAAAAARSNNAGEMAKLPLAPIKQKHQQKEKPSFLPTIKLIEIRRSPTKPLSLSSTANNNNNASSTAPSRCRLPLPIQLRTGWAELEQLRRSLVQQLEKFVKNRNRKGGEGGGGGGIHELKQRQQQQQQHQLPIAPLAMLNQSRQESERLSLGLDHCRLFVACQSELRQLQAKQCPNPVEGRLVPGPPKRRFGRCNSRLLPLFERADSVRAELERDAEKCVAKEVAKGGESQKSTKAECPRDWPLLPPLPPQMDCPERVALLHQHCRKLGRCCASLERCQKRVDSSGLARRVRLEEQRLARRSVRCQLQAQEMFRTFKEMRAKQQQQQRKQHQRQSREMEMFLQPNLLGKQQ